MDHRIERERLICRVEEQSAPEIRGSAFPRRDGGTAVPFYEGGGGGQPTGLTVGGRWRQLPPDARSQYFTPSRQGERFRSFTEKTAVSPSPMFSHLSVVHRGDMLIGFGGVLVMFCEHAPRGNKTARRRPANLVCWPPKGVSFLKKTHGEGNFVLSIFMARNRISQLDFLHTDKNYSRL